MSVKSSFTYSHRNKYNDKFKINKIFVERQKLFGKIPKFIDPTYFDINFSLKHNQMESNSQNLEHVVCTCPQEPG